MDFRPLFRYTAWGWFGLAVASAAGALVFLVGAAALAAGGPQPGAVASGPGGWLLAALQALVGAFAFWTAGLVTFDRAKEGGEG